jgi:hypothetical protein
MNIALATIKAMPRARSAPDLSRGRGYAIVFITNQLLVDYRLSMPTAIRIGDLKWLTCESTVLLSSQFIHQYHALGELQLCHNGLNAPNVF